MSVFEFLPVIRSLIIYLLFSLSGVNQDVRVLSGVMGLITRDHPIRQDGDTIREMAVRIAVDGETESSSIIPKGRKMYVWKTAT